MNYTAVTRFDELEVGDSLIINTHGKFEEIKFQRVGRQLIFPFRDVGEGTDSLGEFKAFYLNQIKMNITKATR